LFSLGAFVLLRRTSWGWYNLQKDTADGDGAIKLVEGMETGRRGRNAVAGRQVK